MQRKEVEAAFEQTVDNGAPRHFDGDGYPLRLSSRQRPEPVRQPGKTGAIMVHNSFTHPPTVAVEHVDLMLLRAPINPHKPLVRQRLILSFWMYAGRYDQAHSSLSFLSRVSLFGDLP